MLQIDKSWNGREIELLVGETLELELRENRTAGYQWKIVPSNEPVLAIARLEEDGRSRSTEGAMICGGSRDGRWRIVGHQVGTSVLDMHYEGPARQRTDTFSLKVRVKRP